jgi:hypothetical protein
MLAGAYSLIRIGHTALIHRRTWTLSVALAELDRERRAGLA